MNDNMKHDMNRDPAELEREADRARANVEHTLEALERRLSPGQLLDQVMHVVRENGGDFGRNLSTQVRNNPLPTLLAGAGIAWLMTASDRPPRSYPRTGMTSGPSMGSRASSAASSARGAASHAGETTRSAAHSARSAISSAAETARGALGTATHGTRAAMGSMAGATRHSAQSMAYASRSGAESLVHGYDYLRREQPLVLGVLAVATGALIGAMLPKTRAEDEWIGEQSDEATRLLKQQARERAEEAKHKAAEMAEAARSAAGSERTGGSEQPAGSGSTSGGYGSAAAQSGATSGTSEPQSGL